MATTTQARTDNSIREDVLRELNWDPTITSASDIAVAAKDGVVTLSGFVPTYWDKDAAEKAAKRVYGVKGVRAAWSAPGTTMVENHIMVNP
jgi:osmotically-inducible protein OsmY